MKKSKKILVDSLAIEVLDLLEILIDRTWTFLENQAEAKITKSYKLLRILTDEDFFFFLMVSLKPFVHIFSNQKKLQCAQHSDVTQFSQLSLWKRRIKKSL